MEENKNTKNKFSFFIECKDNLYKLFSMKFDLDGSFYVFPVKPKKGFSSIKYGQCEFSKDENKLITQNKMVEQLSGLHFTVHPNKDNKEKRQQQFGPRINQQKNLGKNIETTFLNWYPPKDFMELLCIAFPKKVEKFSKESQKNKQFNNIIIKIGKNIFTQINYNFIINFVVYPKTSTKKEIINYIKKQNKRLNISHHIFKLADIKYNCVIYFSWLNLDIQNPTLLWPTL